MDIGGTRAALLPTPAEPVRAVAAAPAPEAVRTLMPRANSVQQSAGAGGPSQDERAPAGTTGDTVERQITVDIETQKIVFKAVDPQTGDVIMQLPDARALKAYADQRRKSETDDTQSASLERLA